MGTSNTGATRILAGLLALCCWSGGSYASCPGWHPPPAPSIADARTSTLCNGTRFEVRVRELQSAAPEADADRAVAASNFRLMSNVTMIDPDPTCGIHYPESSWVSCAASSELITSEKDSADYLASFDKIPRHSEGDPEQDVQCTTVFGVLLSDYASRYNQHLVEHPLYPHKDLCVPPLPKSQSGYIQFDQWQTIYSRFSANPRVGTRPDTYPDLQTAARFGDLQAVKVFVANGAQLTARDIWGLTALEWSVIRDEPGVIDYLMQIPGAETQPYCGALDQAVARDRSRYLQKLTSACAKIEGAAADNHRNHLINGAADRGQVETLRIMIEAGFNPNAAEPTGEMIKEDRAENFRSSMYASYSFDEQQHPLTDSFAEYERVQACPATHAAAKGHLDALKFLLNAGADLNGTCSGSWKFSPLRGALWGKQAEVVTYLLSRGAKEDVPKDVKYDPGGVVSQAIEAGPVVLEQVIRAGADLDKANSSGLPPIFWAGRSLQKGSTREEMFELLLKSGANPNARSQPPEHANASFDADQLGLHPASGRTALMDALAWSAVEWAGTVVFGGKLPSPPPPGSKLSCIETIKILLEHGADVRLSDSVGLTALHYAARTDYGQEASQLLLSRGANINAIDDQGRTPLDHAIERDLVFMPEFLISKGAKRGDDLSKPTLR
jgi:ankyrin repeat protein